MTGGDKGWDRAGREVVVAVSLSPSPMDSLRLAEAGSGETGLSFARNQFRGSSRETKPPFEPTAPLPATGAADAGAGIVAATLGAVVSGGAPEFSASSRAGLTGSSSVSRTTSIFGADGGLSLLTGGGDVAAMTRGGGAEVAAFVRGAGKARVD